MRKLIVFATVSLDGFMAGPENHLGFMVEDEEMDRRMTAELMRTADTIVIGRNAYQDMAAHWPHASDQFAQWMNATPKVVFSKTLEGLAWETRYSPAATSSRRSIDSSGKAGVTSSSSATCARCAASSLSA